MHRQASDTLEFNKLKAQLLAEVRTPLGASVVSDLSASSDLDTIVVALRSTSEGAAYLREGSSIELSDLPDPRPPLAKLSIADINLEPREILDLLRLMAVSLGLRESFDAESDRFPLIHEITSSIANLRALNQKLRGRILPNGEVDDFASPELREVRHQISRSRTQIQRSLESALKRADEAHALQEEFITVRNDRYVVPIRNDNRKAIAGVVHGLSSSGQTVFIEPLETIELNNELVRLREVEQAEVTKVLFGITAQLQEELPALEQMAKAVAEIDFIFGKARLSIRHRATEPKVNQSGRLLLKDARHPLLEAHLAQQGLTVVPMSLELQGDRRVMVISGPNAGGKTVVLKTVGLLALMAQSGLHVPAAAAELPVFNDVQADIGDHQSIAANLSTFTSHIVNIRSISAGLEIPAIILLDEVGTGTDPEEGSALGVGIVDFFKQRGAHVLVTTHYSGLKAYATNSSDVINASVEFDERTLKPTYRLLVGVAGSSSGIEIARRFGLPEEITGRAAELVHRSSAEAIEYLRRLKEQFEEQQQVLTALDEERAAVAGKYAGLENQFNKRERDREREFREQLQQVIGEFEKRGQRMIARIEDVAASRKARKESERRVIELKSAAGAAALKMRQTSTESGAPERPASAEAHVETEAHDEFLVGDRVALLALGNEGIVESVSSDEIGVQVGALRFREHPERLRLVERRKSTAGRRLSSGISVALQEQLETRRELNVIGRTSAEATEEADKFLDAAFLGNVDRVRIIHGIGMGALKRAISSLLTGHPHVARFFTADQAEGGQGATIVELKQ
jgi:DNA mismatch repair protein MutS2